MRDLIKIIKAFQLVCVAIFLCTVYALFAKGIEWIPFCAMSFFMALHLKREYEQMEADIQEALKKAVKEVWKECRGSESGEYTVEYKHNDNWYYITFLYYVTYTECIGAEHMGRYEILLDKDIEEITITELECRDDDTGEVTDCGFTMKELQEAL